MEPTKQLTNDQKRRKCYTREGEEKIKKSSITEDDLLSHLVNSLDGRITTEIRPENRSNEGIAFATIYAEPEQEK